MTEDQNNQGSSVAWTLETQVTYADGSIVSKPLYDKGTGSLTLFAFDAGQKLSEHTAPFDAFVNVLDGHAVISIAGQEHELSQGQMILMPANIPHAVLARERFKMLLMMFKAGPE